VGPVNFPWISQTPVNFPWNLAHKKNSTMKSRIFSRELGWSLVMWPVRSSPKWPVLCQVDVKPYYTIRYHCWCRFLFSHGSGGTLSWLLVSVCLSVQDTSPPKLLNRCGWNFAQGQRSVLDMCLIFCWRLLGICGMDFLFLFAFWKTQIWFGMSLVGFG